MFGYVLQKLLGPIVDLVGGHLQRKAEEKMMQGGFASIAIIITVAIAILEFAR